MERKLRYRQKINFIAEKISDIPRNPDNALAIDAALYRIQTAIDACIDIVAMLLKDKGREVTDDYGNIHKLLELNVLDKKLSDGLAMLNGLRNAIVHKYNTFEEETVINSINNIKDIIERFLDVVENELKTIFKGNKKGPKRT